MSQWPKPPNKVITEQVTRTTLEGAAKAIGEAKQLDTALDGVVESSQATERSLISAEKALEKFNRQFEPGYRDAKRLEAAQRDLKRALDQGLVSSDDYERKLKLVSGANDNVTKTTGLARHQVQNFTAQFVDLGVQLSAGGGILLPLIQQGPQAVDAVGGLSKAMELLRAEMASFIGCLERCDYWYRYGCRHWPCNEGHSRSFDSTCSNDAAGTA